MKQKKKCYSSSITAATPMLLISQDNYLQLYSRQMPIREFHGVSVNYRCFEPSEFTT